MKTKEEILQEAWTNTETDKDKEFFNELLVQINKLGFDIIQVDLIKPS